MTLKQWQELQKAIKKLTAYGKSEQATVSEKDIKVLIEYIQENY